ncbi:NAD(P)/FAD-dependent oxidoreductase [Streptomyces spinoverrucosus]|uniref:NAD(P)/FAD-dependent oxidoreductase n=1 Tax=Streptomyces spinoverrucosus TaxID=284043 RepID=UPI0018C3893B|nr:NAD(P)/FAD-dependent oxidoreductase [Streptomyces spinoverrucosus]MBG0852172.1 NAD(P)/FAD-dependent oxidoreductase [Streptomyces spinoverrucosus]
MTLLRRLLFGVVAGLPGGAIVALVTNPPWLPWAAHAVVLGAVLGLLFGAHRQSNGSAFAVGLLIGLLDWVTWTLTLVPVFEGQRPSWAIAVAVSRFPELVGAALFGATAGLTFHALSTWRPPRPAPQRAKPHVVITGGGFGGVGAARELDRRIGRGLDAHVTLISDSNFLLFTPLLVGVASSTVEARHVSAPVRAGLDHASFLHGRVVRIDTRTRNAYVSAGKEGMLRVPYDHLVLAVGGVPHFFDLPGVGEHAFPMKSVEDATRLRNQVLSALERADLEPDPAEQARLLTFVVAGGGFAGTELVAELFDLVHDVLHFYPRLHGLRPRFVLVHSGERLLPELSPRLGLYAQRKLGGRGIEFRLGTRVSKATAEDITLDSGESIPTRTLAWTAGNRPNPLAQQVMRGPLVVEPTMRIPGASGLWALGDCARIPDAAGGFHPPTAQHAIREGRAVARNIAAVLRGRRPEPFRFGGLGVLVSLGHRTAAGEIGGRRVSGFLAWVLWRSVYLSKLPSTEKRLRVLADWTLDLVFPRDIALSSKDDRHA